MNPSRNGLPPPRVCIIILNWNGWQDTIECLESIRRSDYPDCCTVVVDNGSRDDSCKRIQAWAEENKAAGPRAGDNLIGGESLRVILYERAAAESRRSGENGRELPMSPAASRLALIQVGENRGFAGGSNIGIRYAQAVGSEFVWLLNNDTVVEKAALGRMVYFLESHSDFQGVTGQIRLHGDPSRIWHCGGTLTCFGTRRYHYLNSPSARVPQRGFKRISYITCCAAVFRVSLFKKVGLLSERFFFGEEDFELSQRLKPSKFKLACLYDAIVYHKVGKSIDKVIRRENLPKSYIYYLNRFIDMRHYWRRFPWQLWRFSYFFYIFPLLKLRHGVSWNDFRSFRRQLIKDSTDLDGVSKATFERLLRFNFGEDAPRT